MMFEQNERWEFWEESLRNQGFEVESIIWLINPFQPNTCQKYACSCINNKHKHTIRVLQNMHLMDILQQSGIHSNSLKNSLNSFRTKFGFSSNHQNKNLLQLLDQLNIFEKWKITQRIIFSRRDIHKTQENNTFPFGLIYQNVYF